MKAKEAINGQKYRLPTSKYYLFDEGICQGANPTEEWVWFLTFDEQGERHIRTVSPNVDIIAL